MDTTVLSGEPSQKKSFFEFFTFGRNIDFYELPNGLITFTIGLLGAMLRFLNVWIHLDAYFCRKMKVSATFFKFRRKSRKKGGFGPSIEISKAVGRIFKNPRRWPENSV